MTQKTFSQLLDERDKAIASYGIYYDRYLGNPNDDIEQANAAIDAYMEELRGKRE